MGRKGLVGEYKNNNKKEKKRKEKNLKIIYKNILKIINDLAY